MVDAKFKAIFDQGLLFMGITDLEGRLLELNQLTVDVCGFRREDVLGVPIWQSGWFNQIPGLAENVKNSVEQAAKGVTFRADIAYSWSDGSEHFANFILIPIKDTHGRVLFLSPIGFDITDRVKSATILKEKERLLRLISDGMPALISYVDKDLRYRSVNREWLNWFDRPAEAVVGKTVEEVLGETSWKVICTNIERALAGERVTLQRQLQHPDGSMRWLEVTYVPDADEAGSVVGFVAHAYDITRRKLAEDNLSLLNVSLEGQVVQRNQALRLGEEKLKLATEAGGIGVWDYDPATQELKWNNAMFTMHGARPQDFSGRYDAWASRLHPEDRAAAESALADAIAGVKDYALEFRIVWPDGQVRYIRAATYIFRDAEGKALHMTGTNVDITEIKCRQAGLAFLDELQKGIAPFATPDQIMSDVCRRTADYFNLTHCALVETNETSDFCKVIWDRNTSGAPNLKGEYRLSDYHTQQEREFLRRGSSLVLNDVYLNKELVNRKEVFESLHIRSMINTPYLAEGSWKFVLHCSRSKVSFWSAIDIELLQSLTPRIYLRLERARTEEALRISEARFRAVAENLGDGLVLTNLDDVILDVNPRLLAMTGYERHDVIGRRGIDIFLSPTEAKRMQANNRARTEGKTDIYEMELRRKDDSVFGVEITGAPLRDAYGVIFGTVGVVRDITQRRATADALIRSEAMSRSILNALPSHIAVLDDSGTIVAVNAAWMRYYENHGGDDSQMAGIGQNYLTVCDRVLGGERAKAEEAAAGVRAVLRSEISQFEMEYECHAPSELAWFLMACTPMAAPYKGVVVSHRDITARKLAELARAEAERHYRILFDHAGVGVAELDSNTGRFLRVNQKNLKILGYTEAEMLALTFMDVTYLDDLAQDVANMERMLTGESRGFAMEKRLLRKNKSLIWVNLNVSPLWSPGEEPSTHIAVVEDITERKCAELELQRIQGQWRAVMESMTEGLVIGTMDGDLVYWNRAAIHIFGYSSLADLQRNLSDFATQYELSTLEGQILTVEQWPVSRVLRRERLVELELNVRRLDRSSEQVISYSGEIVRDPAGTELAFLTFNDITERKRADKKFHDSQQRLDLALSGTDAGVWDWNVQTGAVTYDKRWTGMLGYTVNEVEMEYGFWEKSVHPEDLPWVLEQLNAHLTGKNPDYRVEHRLKHKDGSWVWIQATGRVVEWSADGKPFRACGTHLNITGRKQMETALIASEKLAVTGRLAAGIAHEINNPLNGIKNCFRLVKDALPEDNSVQRYAGLIDREIDRMATVVRRMFTLYRPGKTVSKEFDVNDLVQDMAELAKSSVDVRNQRINTLRPEFKVTVFLPEAILSEVLHNLIQNAMDASPIGGEVRISYSVIDEKLLLTVADDGAGIPEAQRNHIFEPFFTTKENTSRSGMGMGLALVRANVELLQGRIWFDSKPGAGATFFVELPQRIESVMAKS